MTTFTTTITAMYTLPQVDGQTDVVVNAVYKVTGMQDTYAAAVSGSHVFTLQPGAEFTPFAQLTQDKVTGCLSPEIIANAQTRVQSQIDSMITPPVSPALQALPWVA